MTTTLEDDNSRGAGPEIFGPVSDNAQPRAKLQRLLVPVDFTPASQRALRYAAMLGERFGSTICLLHVVEAHPCAMGEAALMLTMQDEELARDTAEQLKQLAQLEIPANLVIKLLVRYGSSAREILNAAETLAVDLIVLATHRRSTLGRLLLGSTATQIERHAVCPVLIVPCRDDCGNEASLWQDARTDAFDTQQLPAA